MDIKTLVENPPSLLGPLQGTKGAFTALEPMGWPKGSFRFSHDTLQKNVNESLGQPYMLSYTTINFRIINLPLRSLFSQSLILEGGTPPISSCCYTDMFK